MRAIDLFLSEGGNVDIGGQQAQRIDLTQISREKILPTIDATLQAINNAYFKQFKQPLWSPELIKSREFLSGSSYHFFNQAIPHTEFVKVKPMVGDIDTQVDITQKDNVAKFLQSIQGKQVGPATLIGFKPSGEQYISLWDFPNPPIKIQIDFELVQYAKGTPTEWSRFAHSSSWEDLQAGVKGVFHKYLMRAFTTNTLRERIIQMKSGKLKKVLSTDVGFAASGGGGGGGMREKYKPVIDPETGEQRQVDGLPVFTELATSDSDYVNNISGMFEMIFNKAPDEQEKKLLGSFTGGIQLANKYLDDAAKQKLLKGFIQTLYGPAAQALYKGDPESDRAEKEVALNTLVKGLGVNYNKADVDNLRNGFYTKYKVKASVTEDVKASPRQGVQHLQKMKDVEFIDFIRNVKDELGGKLSNVKMTLKIDGLGARFGKDANGRVFFESSRSGPIFTGGMFAAHAKSRGFEGENLERAHHYDEIFNLVTTSQFAKKVPNNTKVACEILYNPMAEETEKGLKFVTVSYDKAVLGAKMSIVPLYCEIASTSEPHPDSDKIKQMLVSTKEENGIRFIDNRLGYHKEIDATAIIDPLLTLVDDKFISTITSRTRADAGAKSELKALVQTVKDQLGAFIIQHPDIAGKGRLGKEIEGLILYRDGQAPVKVTTPDFKQAIAAKKQPNTAQNPPV